MSTKIFLAAIAALLIGIGALGYRLSKANSRAVEATNLAQEYKGSLDRTSLALEALRKSSAKAQAVAKDRQAVADQQLKEQKEKNRALSEALEASREWADAPIPAGVRDILAN